MSESRTEALLVDAKAAAALCGIGRSCWYSLLSAGRVPRPVKLGRAVRWRRDELTAWVRAGCPARDRWEVQWRASA